MRIARDSFLLALIAVAACKTPTPIVDQRAIADNASGPCALFNWMAHGDELRDAFGGISADRTPVEAVRKIIETYGTRPSATDPPVERYVQDGVGPIDLMLMARELLDDHAESPPSLRGEYLYQLDGESDVDHLGRITRWFSDSIDAGVPVLLYFPVARQFSYSDDPPTYPRHIVVTTIDEISTLPGRTPGIGFTFVDSASGSVGQGRMVVPREDFKAPTFTYRFDEGGVVVIERDVRSGSPFLEVRIPSHRSFNGNGKVLLIAQFATFADTL